MTEGGGILVTGASTGIGRACALALDEAGYRVFGGVRKQQDADSLAGGNGNDDLFGGAARDSLGGGNGDDTLSGGGSADRLVGNAGVDTLIGGGGADAFVLRKLTDSGLTDETRDMILDFTVGIDRIDVRNLFDDEVAFTKVGAFSGREGEFMVVDRVLWLDVTGNGQADTSIGFGDGDANLDGQIDASDFLAWNEG